LLWIIFPYHQPIFTGWSNSCIFAIIDVGSEGSLGIVTKVSILTPPKLPSVNIAFLACEDYLSCQVCFQVKMTEASSSENIFFFHMLLLQNIQIIKYVHAYIFLVDVVLALLYQYVFHHLLNSWELFYTSYIVRFDRNWIFVSSHP
jgi:hypothetical protein